MSVQPVAAVKQVHVIAVATSFLSRAITILVPPHAVTTPAIVVNWHRRLPTSPGRDETVAIVPSEVEATCAATPLAGKYTAAEVLVTVEDVPLNAVRFGPDVTEYPGTENARHASSTDNRNLNLLTSCLLVVIFDRTVWN